MSVEKVIILCDNFRIGGIQRLTLDQSYYLNSKGIKTVIVVLGARPDIESPTFLYLEEDLIKSLCIEFVFVPGGRLRQFFELTRLINGENIGTLICHSLRATVLLFMARIFCKNKVRIVTTIHQLLSMSAPLQRVRRVIYSQFSDQLFGYSVAVIDDWNYRRANNPFLRLISVRKKISLCRNGVFLPRLNFDEKILTDAPFEIRRLLFVNRITAWKGLSTFLELLSISKFEKLKMLIMTPTNPDSLLIDLNPEARSRIQKIVGKSLSQIRFSPGDLHLYPANYGDASKFIEGVSINVLEFASLGIRSIVTENGLSTWPDLASLGVLKYTNWNEISEIENSINECESVLQKETIMITRNLVDVRHNLQTLLADASSELCLKLG